MSTDTLFQAHPSDAGVDTGEPATDSDAPALGRREPPFEIGRYRVEERLGSGGMGEVYRAWDKRLHRFVALKQVRPGRHAHAKMRRRFLREARAAARIDHPAVARVFDLLELADSDWIVMELAVGRSIEDLVREGPLPPLLALSFALQVADGLAAAHDRDIVHRDLKSDNVVLTEGGRLKILDFGLAKPLGAETTDESTLSRIGQLIGTPRAMSPEQARGYAVDARSDLFSLGSLLYEMVTGEMPFAAASPLQSLTRVCTYEPPPPSRKIRGLPAAVDRVVARLLEKDPEARPADAREALLLLREAASSLPLEDDHASTGFVPVFLPARPVTPFPRSHRRALWLAFAIGATSGAALVGAMIVWL